MINKSKLVIFDLETLCNCFTGCFLDYETKKKKEFVLFDDKEQFNELVRFLYRLRNNEYYFVGFNCVQFDCQIIEYILFNAVKFQEYTIEYIVELIYEEAQRIINLPEEEKFKSLIYESKFNIPCIDLYLQKHYNRPQKACSLKWLQFSMRYKNIEEMPTPHDVPIHKEDIEKILSYNWNDVDSTCDFFDRIMFETDLRDTLSERYNLNLINASEPKMVREIFGKLLSEDMQILYSELKKKKTFRSNVRLDEIIFPYIKFTTSECNNILNWFKSLNINIHLKEEKIEKVINFAQCETVFGLGGIHGCIKPGRYKSSDNLIIEDIDVVSFYPNLAIQNNIKPEHLGDSFNKIYNNIFQERKSIPKKDPMNYVFKIILNSCYGLSKEANGYLYDPKFTYSITVNGQLSILMLAEKLLKEIPNIIFYQMNTDGISIGYEPQYKDKVKEICEWFCKITKLELENVFYKEMVIRDVNNYIGIYTDGKCKKKGTFETEMDYHKNPSFLVIPKAVEAYFVKGQDYKTFIDNHEDIFDFMGGVKKKSSFELNLYSFDGVLVKADKQQKVTRFYVAKKGRKFFKDFKDGRRVGILADWYVESCNSVENKDVEEIRKNLDLRFYYKEVEKLIHEIEGNKLQMSLFD